MDRRNIKPGDFFVTNTEGEVVGAGIGGAAQPSLFLVLTSVTIAASTKIFTDDNFVRADATSGNIVITLPDVPFNGEMVTVKKIDSSAHTVTINGNVANIDGAGTQVISAQYASLSMVFDFASNTWNIV